MDRRDFLKLAGLGSAIAAAGLYGCAGTNARASWVSANNGGDVSFTKSCDVLVIGSGIAGMSAAMAPCEAGLSVSIAEKGSLLGGESYESSCLLEVQGTKIQADAGMAGSPDSEWEARKESLNQLGEEANVDEALLEKICRTRPEWVDKAISEYGAQFADPTGYADLPNSDKIIFPKSGIGGLDDVMIPIRDTLTSAGVEYHLGMEAQCFITDENGTLCGARLFSPETNSYTDIEAKKVIIASGGWISNQKMVSENLPNLLNVGSYGFLSDGQAITLAQGLGATVSNMEATPSLIGDIPIADAWASFGPTIALNINARRFAREDVRYNCANEAYAQGLGCWWTVFDQKMSEGPQANSVAMIAQKCPDRYVGPCETIDDLAQATGMDVDDLRTTMAAYNSAAENGHDDDFGKEAFLQPIEAPFHAIRQHPIRFRSLGGLKVNESFQVTDSVGAAIENLYACGSCADILSNGFLDNAASGLLAGRSACS